MPTCLDYCIQQWPLDGGGADVVYRIKEMAMSHVSVNRKIALSSVTNQIYPCRM